MITSPDELRAVNKAMIRHVFGVGYPTITKWMPDIEKIDASNGNGTFDLIKMVQWKCDARIKKEPEGKAELELEKLRADIDLKNAQLQKVKENFVDRSIANQEKISLLKIISLFLEQVPSYRKQLFHMIHADVAEKRLRDTFKEAMDQVADAPESTSE